MPHPKYSPDCCPYDIFLLREVKIQLKGYLFESAEDTCRAFTKAVEGIPKPTWAEDKWFHYIALCIAAEGSFLKKKI